jgi:soluble lytic murein transglycosylase-like protein
MNEQFMGDTLPPVEKNKVEKTEDFEELLRTNMEQQNNMLFDEADYSEPQPESILIPPRKNPLQSLLKNKTSPDMLQQIINQVVKEKKAEKPVISQEKEIENAVHAASQKWRIDPHLLKAMIDVESSFDPQAKSSKGAEGLMQLMPDTAREMGVENPSNIKENVNGGAKYLRQMIDRYTDVEKALAAYNAGPATVDKYEGIPPYKETVAYVEKVLRRYIEFRNGDQFE